jgi:adenylate cyclase
VTKDRLTFWVAAALISVCVGAGTIAARSQGLLEPLELMGYDLGLAVQPAPETPAPITLIAITEADIAALGRWPVSDSELQVAITQIAEYEPRVIGLDIYRDIPVPPGTSELHAALAELESLIGIFKFHSATSAGVGPAPSLIGSGRIGFSDVVLDHGGIVRRGLAFLDDGDSVAWSFSLKLALAYLAGDNVDLVPDESDPRHFKLGEVSVAPLTADYGGYNAVDNAGYQYLVDYSQPARAFSTYTLGDLVAGSIPAMELRDRIVIMGVDAQSVKDSFATPLGQWPWSTAPNISGIELHARMVDQLLRAGLSGTPPMTAWPTGMEYLLIMAACFGGGFAGLRSRSMKHLLVIGSAGVGLVCALGLGLFWARIWLPAVPMALGCLTASAFVTAYLVQRTRHERAALQRILSLQVSPAVAGAIWQRRDELLEEGVIRPQNLTATVLFMDLQGFTRLSETLTPAELIAWLNPIMELATRTVLEHDGMVDDYFGDGIKANFGVPFARTTEAGFVQDARNAVRCALALVERAEQLSSAAEHPYRVRIGIHTGPVVTGSIGGRERMKYTSIGNTVNVAARLESFAKDAIPEANRQILVSAETARYVGDEFDLRSLGAVALKGKAQLTSVYHLRGLRGRAGDAMAPQGQRSR